MQTVGKAICILNFVLYAIVQAVKWIVCSLLGSILLAAQIGCAIHMLFHFDMVKAMAIAFYCAFGNMLLIGAYMAFESISTFVHEL